MEKDNYSFGQAMKVAGGFMTVSGLVGALLVLFVLPGNNYFAGVMLLMLAIMLISGLMILAVGLVLTYRRVIGRAIMMPAVLLARLIGR